MVREKMYRLGLLAGLPAFVSLLGASAVQAAYPLDLMTFDDTSTVKTTADFNPPPIITRFDFGSGVTGTATSWDGTVDHTGNSGGSIVQSGSFSTSGGANDAFTLDVTNNLPINATGLDFYIRLAPGSAFSTLTGPGTSGASSGFFSVATRDGSYAFHNVTTTFVNGNANGSGWNFGDPTFSGASDAGSWEHIFIPLSGAAAAVRAITFGDFDDNNASRAFSGPVTWNIDDL